MLGQNNFLNQSHILEGNMNKMVSQKKKTRYGSEEKCPSFLLNKNSPVTTNYFAFVSILRGSGFIKQSNFIF